jgi:hypothetical protein
MKSAYLVLLCEPSGVLTIVPPHLHWPLRDDFNAALKITTLFTTLPPTPAAYGHGRTFGPPPA